MEALFVLIIIALLAIPAVVIWLAFSHVSLKRSVASLSHEVALLKSGRQTPQETTSKTDVVKEHVPAQPLADKPPLVEKLPEKARPVPPVTVLDAPPKSYVFDASNLGRLLAWLKENWFIAIAALSLAMAGIFLVQYGIENGVLSPRNRVLCALVFGAGLIGFGEWVRRKASDETGTTAFLPSAFAGAGVVTLFAAILSAQQMYGLIGKEFAFIALVGLAAFALVLGWLYGAFLTVIGLIGAVAAPFITSDGTSENIEWLFYYFALIAVVGLGVDAMKRSAWGSSLALIIPYIGASVIWVVSSSEHFIAFAALIAIAATCIPTLHLSLAVVAIFVSLAGAAGFWLALGALGLTLAMLGYWLNRTDTLDDLAIPVALAALAIIGLNGLLNLDVARAFSAPLNLDLGETAPRTATWLVAFGLGTSALAGWRSLRDPRHSLYWAAGTAIFAPATVGLLTLYWEPLTHLTSIQWASHVIAVAILMTLFAEQALRLTASRDEITGRLQVSLFALAALNMIAFALSIVLTETALTLGFAGIAASAAWLDRKFDIRPVSWFVQLGIIVCSYRLVADPGLLWAIDAPLFEVFIGFLGTIALIAVAWNGLDDLCCRAALPHKSWWVLQAGSSWPWYGLRRVRLGIPWPLNDSRKSVGDRFGRWSANRRQFACCLSIARCLARRRRMVLRASRKLASHRPRSHRGYRYDSLRWTRNSPPLARQRFDRLWRRGGRVIQLYHRHVARRVYRPGSRLDEKVDRPATGCLRHHCSDHRKSLPDRHERFGGPDAGTFLPRSWFGFGGSSAAEPLGF